MPAYTPAGHSGKRVQALPEGLHTLADACYDAFLHETGNIVEKCGLRKCFLHKMANIVEKTKASIRVGAGLKLVGVGSDLTVEDDYRFCDGLFRQAGEFDCLLGAFEAKACVTGDAVYHVALEGFECDF